MLREASLNVLIGRIDLVGESVGVHLRVLHANLLGPPAELSLDFRRRDADAVGDQGAQPLFEQLSAQLIFEVLDAQAAQLETPADLPAADELAVGLEFGRGHQPARDLVVGHAHAEPIGLELYEPPNHEALKHLLLELHPLEHLLGDPPLIEPIVEAPLLEIRPLKLAHGDRALADMAEGLHGAVGAAAVHGGYVQDDESRYHCPKEVLQIVLVASHVAESHVVSSKWGAETRSLRCYRGEAKAANAPETRAAGPQPKRQPQRRSAAEPQPKRQPQRHGGTESPVTRSELPPENAVVDSKGLRGFVS